MFLYLVILLFIPNIYSEVTDPNVLHSTNNTPWDAYEYAKNISIQLSNELFLNLHPELDLLTEYRVNQYLIPRNGKAIYNGNHFLTPDDSIRNNSFNVQTIDDCTIVEFAPNFRNFSVKYYFPSLSEGLGIDFDYLPVNVTIKHHNRNGSIEAIIKYRDIMNTPELSSNDNAFDYGSKLVQQLSAELINWLDPENRFLQPELDNIVKSLAFPMGNISQSRWTEIVHKTTMDRQKLIYGIFYKYAQSIAGPLATDVFASNITSRSYQNITVPSNLSKNRTLGMQLDYRIKSHFLYRQNSLKFKPGSFSVQSLGNVTILKFSPEYEQSVIAYSFDHNEEMDGTFKIVFNNIPIHFEIEHRSDTGKTNGKVFYGEMKDQDWWIETDNRSAVSNFLFKKFYESPEFQQRLCDFLKPGNTYLQSKLDKILKTNSVFPETQLKSGN